MTVRELLLATELKRLQAENDVLIRVSYGLAGPEPVILDKLLLDSDDIGVEIDGESIEGKVVVKRRLRPEVEKMAAEQLEIPLAERS